MRRLVRVMRILRVYKLVRHFAGLQSLIYTLQQAYREMGLLLLLGMLHYITHNFFAEITVHCKGNSVYIFLFWELRGLGPNFHIHVSVSDLYIPRIGPHISSAEKADPSWEYIIHSQTHECANWD
jgi:hypothetical protein